MERSRRPRRAEWRRGVFLTVADVSKLTDGTVSGGAVRKWANEGKLTTVRTVGGMRLFPRDAVLEFLVRRFVKQLARKPAKRRTR